MDKFTLRQVIAKRVSQELKDGSVVNLGIGLPTLIANYVDNDRQITFQSENGFIGLGTAADDLDKDKDLVNAGGEFVTTVAGAAFFDSVNSFAMIRGGHIDATVLGAFQVDMHGNIANWLVPNGNVSGMGGAMDLIVGSRRVIVAMEHTAKGKKKILKKCTLPLTAKEQVNMIITEMALFEITKDGLILQELGPKATVEDVKEATEAEFSICGELKRFGLE